MKFDSFFRYFGLIVLAIMLNACGSSNSRPQPQILFSEFSEGMPQEKLILMDLEGEIIEDFNIGDRVRKNFSIGEGKFSWVRLSGGRIYIYNAVEQDLIKVNLADEFIDKVDPGLWGFNNIGGDHWGILSSPIGVPVLLVDLENGRTQELTALEDDLILFNGVFSPNEDYIFVNGTKTMIVPTDSINQAREFEKIIFGGFSSDNETFAYSYKDEVSDSWKLIVEDVDGSDLEIVAEYDDMIEARFVPGKEEILIFSYAIDGLTKWSLLSLENDSEEEIGEFGRRVVPQVFSPSGDKLLVINANEDVDEWFLIDLKNIDYEKILGLDDYMLRSSPGLWNEPGWKWVILGKDCSPAPCSEYVSLNIETGKVDQVIEFEEDSNLNQVISQSQDGRFSLEVTINPNQLWLFDAKEKETTLLDEANGGSVSLDGKWVVWTTFEHKGDTPESEMWLMNLESMEKESLGSGMRPIFVQP